MYVHVHAIPACNYMNMLGNFLSIKKKNAETHIYGNYLAGDNLWGSILSVVSDLLFHG